MLKRIPIYLLLAAGAWLFLSQIGNDAVSSEGERRDVLAARAALKMGDSLRATRERAKGLASAKADTARALFRKAHVPVPDYAFAKSVADSMRQLERAYIGLRVSFTRMREAALYFNEARVIDSTRADMAEGQLAIMTAHTLALMKRLEDRRSFQVWFIRLPRPTKWQACLVGATAGAVIDRSVEGASAGCAVATVGLPTR